jgi:hydroxymethylbilane synthase
MAGLNRLGLTDVPRTAVAVEDMLPAVAQGAIGIERRGDDSVAGQMLEAIHDVPTGLRLRAERTFLAHLDGSCETPIGALAELDGGTVRLRGEILRTDGTEVYNDDLSGAIEDGAEMGRVMAAKLLAQAGPDFF